MSTEKTKKFFILRNNDLGDVLVATPLIHGIKKTFPNSKVTMGVGDWAKPLLEKNHDLDEIITCNAPWHNKQNCSFPANSFRTFLQGLLYVAFSREARYISDKRFSHGIDVLGSRQGSWLMRRCKIKNRFGVRGYAGGDKWCQRSVDFREEENVAIAALKFLPLLGSQLVIEPRPRIALTDKEKIWANNEWRSDQRRTKRIVIAPGGGFEEKCWGDKNFVALTKKLIKHPSLKLFIIGSKEDKTRIQLHTNSNLVNYCGKLSVRKSAALVSAADFVITNSSLCMHLAGAFKIPSLTLLGEWYNSAALHKKQWGYPEGIVLGKETSSGINDIISIELALIQICKSIQITKE